MSQHRFKTLHAGRPVCILAGWDRPLQGVFCVVSYECTPGDASPSNPDDDDGNLYSNLSDPDLIASGGLSPGLEYFEEKLAALGLELPVEMIEQIELDRYFNEGNRQAFYVDPAREART